MARTDDDSWDVTETVGQTALGVALSRAHESASEHPLVIDPYAQLFVDAAAGAGWQPPRHMTARFRSMGSYTASRTKWFDEFFIAAGANGIDQAVILAAGLDARAWRLPWAHGTVLYEIDQPKVLAFKTQTLTRREVKPSVPRYVAVPVDLRQDWPKALRDAGFDAAQPTAWSVEGLLPYLPAGGQDLLFDRVQELSAPGSRVAVEFFGSDAFDPEYLAKRQEQIRRLRDEAGEDLDADVPDVSELWYSGERTDLAEWLAEHNWEARTIESVDLMTRYGRWTPDQPDAIVPRTVFIDGHRLC